MADKEKQKQYNSKFKTIRVRVSDYDNLVKIGDKSQIPLVRLIHLAIDYLDWQYGGVIDDNGNSKL